MQELGVAELLFPGVVEFSGQRFGGSTETQVGQVGRGSLDRWRTRSSSLRDLAIDGQVDDGLTPDGPEQSCCFFECLSARWPVRLLVARTRRGEGAQHGGLEGLFVLDGCAPGRPIPPGRGDG